MSAVRAAADATNAELEGAAMLAPVEADPLENAEDNQEVQGQRHEHRRPRTSVQKRIDRLVRTRYEQQQEIYELRARLSELEGAKVDSAETPSEQKAEQRTPSSERDHESRPESEVQQHQAAQEIPDAEHLTANLNRHAERLGEAYRRNPELLELAKVDVAIRPDISVAILEEESSAELVIYLAKNPVEVARLNEMPAWKAYQAISRLAGKLERASAGPRPVPRPKAPPINPVRGSSTTSNVPLDEMSYAEYRRHRESQERSLRRR